MLTSPVISESVIVFSFAKPILVIHGLGRLNGGDAPNRALI
jgi:hypothetical protein